MVSCPVCESVQIVYLVSPRTTSCYYCGASWLQDGSEQSAVDPHRDEVPARAAHPELATVRGGRTEWAKGSA